MSKIDEYIAKRSKINPNFKKQYDEENLNLEIAVQIRNIRKSQNMSQRLLAEKMGKPQSTIARIEKGEYTTIKTLEDIANATNKKLKIVFE